MVVSAHMECPLCGGSFGAWYQDRVETVTCPFCMMAVSVNSELGRPAPTRSTRSWLATLLAVLIKRPLLTQS